MQYWSVCLRRVIWTLLASYQPHRLSGFRSGVQPCAVWWVSETETGEQLSIL